MPFKIISHGDHLLFIFIVITDHTKAQKQIPGVLVLTGKATCTFSFLLKIVCYVYLFICGDVQELVVFREPSAGVSSTFSGCGFEVR